MLTNLEFLEPNQRWVPQSEEHRLASYDLYRNLFKNNHGIVLDESLRAIYPDIKERNELLNVYTNLYKSVSTLWADLLFAETPKILANSEKEQKVLDEIIENNSFFKTCKKVALDVSRFGNGVFKARLVDDKAVVEAISPALWFPVVSPDNIHNADFHVIAYTFEKKAKNKTEKFLKAEIHSKGYIEHKLLKLNDDLVEKEIELGLNDLFDGVESIESTGVDDHLVVPVENLTDSESVYGFSDYEDINPLIKAIETQLTKLGHDLQKQGTVLYGPHSCADQDPITGEWSVNIGKYIPVRNEDPLPGALSYDVQHESVIAYIEQLMSMFYITSETSPAMLHPDLGTGNLSGTALKRLMQRSILKAARLAENFDSSIKRILRSAALLEGTYIEKINIKWQDGLVDDLKEKAEAASIAQEAGLMSQDSAISYVNNADSNEIYSEKEKINQANK